MKEQNLTNNFKLSEFLYSKFYDEEAQIKVIEEYHKDVGIHLNLLALAKNLQILRDYVNQLVNINIAYRPLFWELEQGRDGKSQHVKGKAADIVIDSYSPKKVAGIIEKLIKEDKMSQGGLSAYDTFVHYDHRGYFARW